jgi:hypothetical protein
MNMRFLNLLVQRSNGGGIPFGIHRINPANLFYPPGSPLPGHGTPADAAMAMEDIPLPPASISFHWPCPPPMHCYMDFMAFGRDRGKILALDSMAHLPL